MFTEVTALMKLYINALEERGILEKPRQGRELRSILHLYFLLDEIIQASKEYLRLARHGTNPEVTAELEPFGTSPSEEMERQLALIAHNVVRFCEQLDSLQRRLSVCMPEVPRTVQLRRFRKSALVQWWVKISDERSDFVPEEMVIRLQRLIPDMKNPQFPIRGGCLNIIIYAGSTNSEYLSTRNTAGISTGEANISEMERLRDELGEFLKEKCDVREVF